MCRPRFPPTCKKSRGPAPSRGERRRALSPRETPRARRRARPPPSRPRDIATSPPPRPFHAPHIPLLLRARAERALARARESARARARARDPSTLAPSTHSLSRETARARPRAHDPRQARARAIIYPAIPLSSSTLCSARARARPGTPRGDALAPFPFPAPARSLRVGATRSCLSTKLERARPTDRDRAPTNPSRSSAPTRDSPRSTTAPDPPPSPRAASLVEPCGCSHAPKRGGSRRSPRARTARSTAPA